MEDEQRHHAEKAVRKSTGPELMTRFDELIEQYDGQISRLRMLLKPILIEGGVDTSGYPEEAPYNELHNRLMMFERLNRQLSEVCEMVRL